jgi:hypothetical protein
MPVPDGAHVGGALAYAAATEVIAPANLNTVRHAFSVVKPA